MKKCVKVETVKLTEEQVQLFEFLYDSYRRCRNMFYAQYSGINSMLLVSNKWKLRNLIRKDIKDNNKIPLEDIFHFQGRHWVMALFDACQNINSAWSNLNNKLDKKIAQNENLSNNEKSYCYYVLSVREYWYDILHYKDIPENETIKSFNIDPNRIHYIHNLLRRLTRKFKANIPHSDELNCMLLDQQMYKIIDKDNKTYIQIMTDKQGKPIVLELKSPYTYNKNGDIQLIFDRKKKILKIHKTIDIKEKRNKNKTKEVGVDKGYHNLLSCSTGKEYGIEIGKKFTKEADRLNNKNKGRQHYQNKANKMKRVLEAFDILIKRANEYDKISIIRAKKRVEKQLSHIEKHHLGKYKYDKQHNKAVKELEGIINHEVKQMINEIEATTVVVEDLTCIANKDSGKGKFYNRIMSMWSKGYLRERINYLCELNEIKVEEVNPAYTSQYCSQCGAPIIRSGNHHETANCPNCGKMDANINAANNILQRLNDTEIGKYTKKFKLKTF